MKRIKGFVLLKTSRGQRRGLYARSYTLLRKFTLCSNDVKLQLFQTFCTNIYAAHLWSSYTVYSYNQVKVAYNNAYRALFGCDRFCSASNMFVSNNIATFDCMLRKAVFNFRNRVAISENVLVNTLHNNFSVNNGALYNKWCQMLYCRQI